MKRYDLKYIEEMHSTTGKILVVDDNTANIDVMLTFLDMEGYFEKTTLTPETSMTMVDPDQIKRTLGEIRECGCAIDRQENNCCRPAGFLVGRRH